MWNLPSVSLLTDSLINMSKKHFLKNTNFSYIFQFDMRVRHVRAGTSGDSFAMSIHLMGVPRWKGHQGYG